MLLTKALVSDLTKINFTLKEQCSILVKQNNYMDLFAFKKYLEVI